MSALAEVLRAVSTVFARHDIGWYVFGAQAVAVRGAPRATQDVDITASIASELLTAVVEQLRAAGLEPRFPELFDELLASRAVIPLMHVLFDI